MVAIGAVRAPGHPARHAAPLEARRLGPLAEARRAARPLDPLGRRSRDGSAQTVEELPQDLGQSAAPEGVDDTQGTGPRMNSTRSSGDRDVAAERRSDPRSRLYLRRHYGWFLELLFKAWKGGNHLAESRSAKPVRVLCEVYAKLLGILVQHWVLLTSGWSDPARSLGRALRWIRQSMYELAGLVSRQQWDRLADYVEDVRRELSKTARISRRRKEPSTFQLLDSPGGVDCLFT